MKTKILLGLLATILFSSYAEAKKQLKINLFYTKGSIHSASGDAGKLRVRIRNGLNKADAMLQNSGVQAYLRPNAWYVLSKESVYTDGHDFVRPLELGKRFEKNELKAVAWNQKDKGKHRFSVRQRMNWTKAHLAQIYYHNFEQGGVGKLHGRVSVIPATLADGTIPGHEIGHNLGGRHSMAIKRGWKRIRPDFTWWEYKFTPMFSGNRAESDHSSAKEPLNWIRIRANHMLKFSYPGYKTWGRYYGVWPESFTTVSNGWRRNNRYVVKVWALRHAARFY